MRIGNGYDVHKLVENRSFVLGGEKIAYDKGLDGHSDADVLVHAIIDAILGAAALGDIGNHFPDTDIRYKNISSMSLLKEVSDAISVNGYFIVNIDTVIVAQKPKLAQYIFNMRQNIAECLNISIDKISVKAKTEEGLGFTGLGLGVAVHAVCLIDNC